MFSVAVPDGPYQWAVVFLAGVVAVLLFTGLISTVVDPIKKALVEKWIGGFVAAATRKKRQEELRAELKKERIKRIRESQDTLFGYLIGQKTGRHRIDASHEAAARALMTLQAEISQYPQGMWPIVGMELAGANQFDAGTIQGGLFEPILQITRPILSGERD
jgi:hypothetical protein